ncbi:CHASE2 domain-containing protein [Halomonas vilamensis]|uniref:CHASE2 domain-containing protein n=1 Tax=Vreelandella vilamensis TaxID=531309 RepID=A0ABU1H8Z6_9GAMM|nr:CHASE2 domain-containing protein [Halomonas vilamensis]MDR5900132.1 CHASE2 domain-containing protein [Halomonas vilamensis]
MLQAPLNRRLAGPWIALITLAAVWLASALGVFQLPNAWMHWQFHHLNLGERPVPQVLLVEADFAQGQPAQWRALVERLEQFDPASIGFLHEPAELSNTQLESLRESGVVIGQTAAQTAGTNRVLTLPPSQALDSLGVHRPQVIDDGERYHSTEAVVASKANDTILVENSFLIDFRPGMNYLPAVQAERVFRGDLTRDLVGGRVVLVGRSIDPTNPALLTPLPEEANVSRLVYAGYAVDTLLRGQPLQATSWWQNLLLSLGILGISVLLYFRLGVRHSLSVSIGGILILLTSGWFSLHLLGIFLPVAELMAFHLLLWFLLSRRERHRESATVRKLLRASSSRLQERLLPEEFNASQEPWGQIILLTTQILNLDRAILLERQGSAKHLREVKAYRCSIEDIDERRRDFERTPYSTALEEGGPIVLSNTFLKNPASGSRQFMVPLEFNGQLLGFLSGEVAEETLKNNPLFLSLLRDFSNQIGELLYQRQLWQARQHSEASPWKRLVRLESLESEYESLSEVSKLFERRLALLENVFNSLHTSTILYDLFGQVMQVNRKMEELVRRSGLSVFTMTAADAIATLGGMPLATAREHLQHMVLTDESLTFAANLPGVKGAFSLNVRPLKSAEAEASSTPTSPFRIYGFLLELVDVTHLVRLERLKDELNNKVSAELRNQLEAALLAAELGRQEDVAMADKKAFSELIESKLQQMSHTLTRSQSITNAVRDISRLSDFPVNVTALAEDLAQRWERHLANRELTFELERPPFNAFVRVDVTQIENTLDAVVAVLADDTTADGVVRLKLEERHEGNVFWTSFIFENTGYGMPKERLRAAMVGSAHDTTLSMHRLKQAVNQVTLWGGELSATTAIGEGIRFELRLPGFSLDD